MMKLSIITINYNNAQGLKKTMESVFNQTSRDFEYIVVDGASTDDSVEIIKSFVNVENLSVNTLFNSFCKSKGGYISEPDQGIYHAMNKGIRLAKGEYVQFLNSSDCLVNADVTNDMLQNLKVIEAQSEVSILYGNMLKIMPTNKILRDPSFKGKEISLLDMFTGTLNHSPVYIKRTLFDTFGLYDEELKFVSDWKWYTKAIIMGGVKTFYVNIDVIYFDMLGVSTLNWDKTLQEKKTEIEKLFPETILKDYKQWAFSIEQMSRIQRHPLAYKCVWFLERCLFKLEKIRNRNFKMICGKL